MIICEITRYKRVPEGEIRSTHMQFLKEYGEKGKILMAGRFADSKGAMIIWDVDVECTSVCHILLHESVSQLGAYPNYSFSC